MDDVAGGGPFTGVRPNAGGVDSGDDRDDIALIGESEGPAQRPNDGLRLRRDKVRGEASAGLRGGEGCKVGGDMVGGR